MRIAQVCPRYYPAIGGVETIVKELSERLAALGHSVDVITTDPTGKLPKQEIIKGVNVIRFKSFAPNEAYYIAPAITAFIAKQDYEIIHAHSYHALPALFAVLGGRWSEIIFSPYYHGGGHTAFRDLLHIPYKFAGRYVFNAAEHVICISDYERKLVDKTFHCDSKIAIIPPGIDKSVFYSLPRNAKWFTLLYVGRLEEYKGVQYVIKALTELQEYRLLVVGTGSYETELQAIAQQYGVNDRILWMKNLSREALLQQYSRADVFVMLSNHESYGIAVAEALTARIPCVVNNSSALSEFVDDINCIGVTNCEDAHRLAAAIRFVQGHTASAPDCIVDWDVTTARILSVYK